MVQKGMIQREDMLELTRRMTVSRNCFSRVAGAYFDDAGYVDGRINKHFQKLSAKDQQKNLELAKTVPFSETNVQLKEYVFEDCERKPGSMWQLLMALRECELKNDALLDVLYERIGENYKTIGEYAFYLYYGNYDIPLKGTDHESQWESEEVYSFMIGVICPVSGDYEPGEPMSGFLFPAFSDRSGDCERIQVCRKSGNTILACFS